MSWVSLPPPLQPGDIERVHRLGRKTDTIRPRAVIARFVSGKTRDRVYRSRATLKTHNHSTDQHHKIFINEDLTTMRSNLAYATRTLKKSKRITDCWTFNGKIVTRFGKNGDTPDKSTKFFPRALDHHSFRFGRGATSPGRQKEAILDFKDGRHVKSISANISAGKPHRRSILVSK